LTHAFVIVFGESESVAASNRALQACVDGSGLSRRHPICLPGRPAALLVPHLQEKFMKSNAATAFFPHRRAVSAWALGLLMACALAHPVKSPAAPDQATPTLIPAPLKPDDSARAVFLWSAVGTAPVAQA
jgi:hypothetical protein